MQGFQESWRLSLQRSSAVGESEERGRGVRLPRLMDADATLALARVPYVP